MGNFFGNIYYLFVDLFGQHLSDYLWGYNCTTGGYDGTVLYLPIGLLTALMTALMCVLYYFAVNHPRLNRWWHWLIVAAAVSAIHIAIGGAWVDHHLQSGQIADCLRIETLQDGTVVENITSGDCWMFGVANGIAAFIWFTILSIVVKRWSSNCRHTPFKSLFPKRNK